MFCHKFIMSKFNLRYIYPFSIFPKSSKKKKKQKTRTGKHIGYFNTVQPHAGDQVLILNISQLFGPNALIPQVQTSFNSTVLFQQHPNKEGHLLKSMPHTETKTSSTQNSSVVVHHSLDNPFSFPHYSQDRSQESV